MDFIRDLGTSIVGEARSDEAVDGVGVGVGNDGDWMASLTRLTEQIANYTLHSLATTMTTTTTTTEVPRSAAAAAATTTTLTTLPPLIAQVTMAAINVAASAMMANSSSLEGGGADGASTGYATSVGGFGDPSTRLEHAPQLSKSSLVKAYVLSVMAVMSLIGNVATMWNIYKTRMARRSSRHTWSAIYSLMFHLSIADLLVTGFCIIGEAAWYFTVQWVADDLTCKLVKLFQMFSLYLSTYVLVLIGVDRWIAVKYPMKSLNMAKRCYRLLGGTYVLSFVLSLPQFFIFHVSKGPFIEEFYQCVTHGFYTALWQEQLYATFTMVFTFLLPLCILFGTYLSTFRTISNSEKMFQGSKLAVYSNKPSVQTNRQRLIHKAKMKSLRISVVIIFAFLICWTPYNIMMIIFTFSNPDKGQGEDLQSGIFFFGMSNSLVNPLIYGAFHLCPMRRKASKYSSNPHSLTRGDSQRTPSLLTAVTQVENNCRSTRSTFRQASYYRSQSNGSSYKEHVGLLQTTPTALKKSASMRSPLASHHQPHAAYQQQQLHLHPQHDQHQHQHQTLSWGVALPSSKAGGSSCTVTSAAGTNPKAGSVGLNGLVGPKENVSSV